jgi:asparagine synthase (glutamine-hydrolysing)
VTVALSGDGGDELFGGYNWYRRVQSSPRREAAWLVERIRRQIGIGRAWPQGCGNEFEYYQLLHCATFSQSELQNLFPAWSSDLSQAMAGQMFEPFSNPAATAGRRWQIIDLHTYLVDNNLTRVDRASMAHGLEVRVPLLDHRLVEFAFSLPEECCIRSDSSKVVLRELMHRRLPENSLTKQKQGFSFPLDRYISISEMWNSLKSGVLVSRGLMDGSALARWQREPEVSNLQMKLWLLFVLEQWARQWLFND